MTTATAPLATREQLIEVLAALRAAGNVLHALHEADSEAGSFFSGTEQQLRAEIFGEEEGAYDVHNPLEVAIDARAHELEADALEAVHRSEGLGERIELLRLIAQRERELGTAAVRFSREIECRRCGRHAYTHEGWQAVPKRDWSDMVCPDCAAGAEEADDAS